MIVVQGTEAGDLRKGPGHYPSTAFPGEGSTVAIAGHRTTYGAPFRHVDELERGDRIIMRMPYGRLTYRVERTRIVDPDATSASSATSGTSSSSSPPAIRSTPRRRGSWSSPVWRASDRVE